MATKVAIDAVDRQGDKWLIAQTHTLDDGTTRRHLVVFPVDQLETRAAEYGIPHTDVTTLLDLVLAEVHMTPDDWAQGHQLHIAPTIADARKDHLARVAKVKKRHGITATAGDPLKRIRDESLIHPEVVAVKAAHIAQVRRHVQAQAAQPGIQAAAAPSGAERAAELRQKLGVHLHDGPDPAGGR